MQILSAFFSIAYLCILFFYHLTYFDYIFTLPFTCHHFVFSFSPTFASSGFFSQIWPPYNPFLLFFSSSSSTVLYLASLPPLYTSATPPYPPCPAAAPFFSLVVIFLQPPERPYIRPNRPPSKPFAFTEMHAYSEADSTYLLVHSICPNIPPITNQLLYDISCRTLHTSERDLPSADSAQQKAASASQDRKKKGISL